MVKPETERRANGGYSSCLLTALLSHYPFQMAVVSASEQVGGRDIRPALKPASKQDNHCKHYLCHHFPNSYLPLSCPRIDHNLSNALLFVSHRTPGLLPCCGQLAPVNERSGDITPLVRGLLPLLHVQFWETENSWRLDSSHRRGHRRDIPCLVDASDVRTVNAFKTPSARSMSALSRFYNSYDRDTFKVRAKRSQYSSVTKTRAKPIMMP